VKGYGDTHERGRVKFEKLCALLPRLGDCGDSAALLESLIKAALADEEGQALDKAVANLMPLPNSSSASRTEFRAHSSGASRLDERSWM
jgi:indolepyruvate ferredoxin oxidoreductase beta subunit